MVIKRRFLQRFYIYFIFYRLANMLMKSGIHSLYTFFEITLFF